MKYQWLIASKEC